MGEFKVGQRVHVEFEGEINYLNARDGSWDVATTLNGESRVIEYLPEIVLSIPSPWPPVVGDIWEADGKEYAVRANTCNVGELVMQPLDIIGTGYVEYYQDRLDEFKALNPSLVRRRGQ